ncbi:MAG: heme exporter protein CcmB [Nannocystaceae bacterium]
MSLLRQAFLLARTDLRQELRDFEMAVTAVFFTFTVLIMFVLAFATLRPDAQSHAIPAFLWITVALTGALTLGRVFDRERETDALSALLVAPVERLAIYAAKLLTTMSVLLMCCIVVVPGLVVVFAGARPLLDRWPASLVLVFLGCLGYAGVGTLFAGGLARGRGKNVLLSLILYPLTMPVLLYALVATQRLLENHPDLWQTLLQMAALDVLLVVVAALLFESLMLESRRYSVPRKEVS